ncbi:unnamed protein product [Lymnaea stagnalis]|uniref:Thioredoxin domain-containing protein 12 n=1 Tax=Lymnaea stagnalis TaxID=6523 RepID=A0AAV2HE21_LYMST
MAPFFMFATSSILGTVAAAAESWGRNIRWVSLKEGQKLAREQKKPAMVVITKTWCRACKALRPQFASNKEIEKMSNDFIMINLEDDDEPKGIDLQPDGTYYPRVVFLDHNGSVMRNVMYKKTGGYKYYYPHATAIAHNMKEVLKVSSKQRKAPLSPKGM